MSDKVTFENDRGEELVGVIHRSGEVNSPGIVMVHGFTGNKDEHGLFVDIAKALKGKGFTVLRFDCAGSGESEGEFNEMTRKTEAEDLRSAIEFLKEQNIDEDRIGVLGLSLGAAVSILAYTPEIKAMALLSAAIVGNILKKRTDDEQLEELERKGYFVKDKEYGTFEVGKKLIYEADSLDFKGIAGKIDAPVLLIHGSEDTVVPLNYAKKAAKYFKNSKLEIIEGSGHNYEKPEYKTEVMEKLSHWFDEKL